MPSWDKEPEGRLVGSLEIDALKPDMWSIMSLGSMEGFVPSGTIDKS